MQEPDWQGSRLPSATNYISRSNVAVKKKAASQKASLAFSLREPETNVRYDIKGAAYTFNDNHPFLYPKPKKRTKPANALPYIWCEPWV